MGDPEEHFLEVIHVKRTNADTITSAITTYPEDMRGVGFDDAATLSERKTGVQTRFVLYSLIAISMTTNSKLSATHQPGIISHTTTWKLFY